MSKSYSNYKKFGICIGNNSLFYKAKRKYLRRINKNILRNALSKGDLNITFKKVSEKYNDWNEPTDGTILETSKTKYKQRIITEQKEKLNKLCTIAAYDNAYFDVFSIPIEIIQYYYFWGFEMKTYYIHNFCKSECFNQSPEYRQYLGEFKPEILRILKELGFKHMEGLERKYL